MHDGVSMHLLEEFSAWLFLRQLAADEVDAVRKIFNVHVTAPQTGKKNKDFWTIYQICRALEVKERELFIVVSVRNSF